MQHLESERIAAFDHEPPSVDELAHLAACVVCRTERQAMNRLSQLGPRASAASTGFDAPRLTNWNSLSARLRAEGLIVGEPVTAEHSVPVIVRTIAGANVTELVESSITVASSNGRVLRPRFAPRSWSEWSRAVAAALVLVVGGAGLGRYSAGAPVVPVASRDSNAPPLTNVSLNNEGFGSLDEANRVLARAQRDYERASLWLAANDTTVHSSEVVRRRLAALDQMMAASRAGLQDAPQDPVLNHYYVAAYSAREATLQQLGSALPVGRSIERF